MGYLASGSHELSTTLTFRATAFPGMEVFMEVLSLRSSYLTGTYQRAEYRSFMFKDFKSFFSFGSKTFKFSMGIKNFSMGFLGYSSKETVGTSSSLFNACSIS
jgi:hypothetical protein